MRFILAALLGVVLAAPAHASCECRCVEGEMQALCSSSIDIAPICPATVCAIPPPSIAPIQPPQVAPLGTSECSPRQVLNPDTHRYEWRRLCN
ncbi:hypothetical protein [Bradyrhizobium sp. STM 3562]|uniref:hypothetical protein n=1 Tax=Bradyrhizobium sp. STM 3562 TaxID=578924 RepID=UPI00388DB052